MTYTPTKEELEELGFYNMNGFLWWKKLWSIGSLTYNQSQNTWFLKQHDWMPSIIIPFQNIGELVVFLKYFQEEGHKFPKLGFDCLELYNKLTQQHTKPYDDTLGYKSIYTEGIFLSEEVCSSLK